MHLRCAPTERFHTERCNFLQKNSTNICGLRKRTELKLREVSSLVIDMIDHTFWKIFSRDEVQNSTIAFNILRGIWNSLLSSLLGTWMWSRYLLLVYAHSEILVSQAIWLARYLWLINNHSPQWRWLVVGIYWAARRWGNYSPPATDTERNQDFFSIYQTIRIKQNL